MTNNKPDTTPAGRTTLTLKFSKVQTNHGITQSKAGSKDLRGVTFGYTPERQLDKTTLILRYSAQQDGTIPREVITYQDEKMAAEAHSILKSSVNKRDTQKQKRFFNAQLKKDVAVETPVAKPAAQRAKTNPRLSRDSGLRRFLGVDLSP